ncbi:putative polyadenylate-binding protein/Hyperplastic disc protein [Helianthus annuus]|nr:putative polyadenylate-binding protein/Hyperplastic disc protein [Helianthus annuus]
MRALSKLIYVNSPDLVLFVGEALAGNDAVDQLSKFNQMVPRGRMYRGPARNIADANMVAGVGSGMLPVPYGMAGVGGMLPLDVAASIPQPMPITALASALANASPDQQRMMLGENLYPLVDQLEHEHAAKVTGMLLEMDQTEVLHLLESPDALKEKVAEAGVMDMAFTATLELLN